MNTTPIFLSNDLKKLANALMQQLFSSFCKRKVVVPDSQMRNFLSLYIAENSPSQIAMGMQLLTLEQLRKQHCGSPMERALRLEHRIATLCEKELFSPLMHYLEASKTPLSTLCQELARVFEKYALYGGKELDLWLQKKGWQQTLWQECKWEVALQENDEWHVFGCNFLPSIYTKAFQKEKAFFYILSPCQYFWEDLCTKKQQVQLEKHLDLSGKEALQEYLQDHNPLLANFGKLGRAFLKQWEDPEMLDLHSEPSQATALSTIQTCLLQLQSIPSLPQDSSIQIFSTPSLFHEVECMFATLHTLITEKGLMPRDIHVMAKDINLYAPYIHMLFGRESCLIPYMICDLNLSSENALVKGFLQLFKIALNRFDPASIFKLCQISCFYEKQGFSKVDREKLEVWTEKTCVRWGVDKEQRDLFLQAAMLEESDAGTWERAFERLLLGLAMLSSDLPSIDISDAELLEKWITFIRNLKEDLRPVIDGTRYKAAHWLSFLKDLCFKYFAIEEDESLIKTLNHLKLSLQDLTAPVFTFHSIYPLLEKLVTAPSGSYKTAQVQSVLFSSFPKGSPIPRKVIWLLGMDEENFPRKEKRSSLLEFQPQAPSKADEDRYLFLESLLSAEEYWIASYVSLSESDHKEQAPSLALQELFSHLKWPLPKTAHLPHLHRIKQMSSPPFFHSFFFPSQIEIPEQKESSLSIKKLEKCAKHPLRFFFHERLHLYLESTSSQEEEFLLSNFTKSDLRKKIWQQDVKKVVAAASKQGKMPLGVFKAVAELRLNEELKIGEELIPESIFSYDLHKTPLCIGSTRITGRLNDISSEGLLFYGDDSLSSLVRIWPLYLVFLCTHQKQEKKDLILLKKAKRLSPPEEDPALLLQKYLDYYHLCLRYPSPLLPVCAKALLEGSHEDLKKALYESGAPFKDDYLEWIKRRDPEIPCAILHDNWRAPMQETFSPLLRWKSR